jgi:hypothetical protein
MVVSKTAIIACACERNICAVAKRSVCNYVNLDRDI